MDVGTLQHSRDYTNSWIVDSSSEQDHSGKTRITNQSESITMSEAGEKAIVTSGEGTSSQDVQKEASHFAEIIMKAPLQEIEKQYPSGVPFIIITLVLMAAIFMTGLDQNILCMNCVLH